MSLYLGLLAGDVRLRMLRWLAAEPTSVSQLAARCGVSIALVSHNLRRLHAAGLVAMDVRARQHIYRLHPALTSPGPGLSVTIPIDEGWQISLNAPAEVVERQARPTVEALPQARRLLQTPPGRLASPSETTEL